MENLEKNESVINRAVKNGVSEVEAKWYLLMLTEQCEKSGLHGIDAERMALDVFDDELAEHEFGESNAFTKYKGEKPRIQAKVLALIDALQLAKDEALKFKDVDDGGTCNFDCPTIRLAGWREKVVKRAAKVVGLDCQKWEDYYMNYHICGACYGQANRRTEMAEAFTKAMEKKGYEADVWYAVD